MIDRRLFLTTAIAASAPARSSKATRQESLIHNSVPSSMPGNVRRRLHHQQHDRTTSFGTPYSIKFLWRKAECRAFVSVQREHRHCALAHFRTHAETPTACSVEGVDEWDTPDGHTIKAPMLALEFRGDLISGWRLCRPRRGRRSEARSVSPRRPKSTNVAKSGVIAAARRQTSRGQDHA
jgi:hypothetical protein